MATQNLSPPKNREFKYCIQGTDITFPCKAYPSQLAVMNRILNGLTRRLNCLIESPTGSGKSLALLCSCLAWQRAIIEQNKMIMETMKYQVNNELKENRNSQSFEDASTISLMDKKYKKCKKMKTKGVNYSEETNSFSLVDWKDGVQEFPSIGQKFDDNDDDFQMPKKLQTSKKLLSHTEDVMAIKTSGNGAKFLGKIPTDISNTVTHSQMTVSMSQCSSKTKLKQISLKSLPTNDLSHNADSDSKSGTASSFETGGGSSDGSIYEYSSVSFGTISTSSTSTSVPNSTLVGNNAFISKMPFDNTISSLTTSNLQDPEKVTLSNTLLLEPTRVPQIYFGTRTHKQITQIVRELKKTIYGNVRMCILASRERTCIHKTVSKSQNINNECLELLDQQQGAGCCHFSRSRNTSFEELRSKGLSTCWDIEDLVKIGKRLNACPYYTIRNLMDAEIIFCPYNYLIDPGIREKMNIKVENNVIVLDEAHNIEDSACEAASFTVTEQELQDALIDISKLSYLGYKTYSHDVVSSVLTGLCNWISKHVDDLTDYSDFNMSGKVWSGEQLIAMLSEIKAGPEDFTYVQKHFNNVTVDERNENSNKPKKPTLNSSTSSLIKDLLRIFGFLYTEELKYMQDYKAVITKEISKRPTMSKTGFVSKNSKGWTHSLNFWCLNPGVAFASIKDQIHSLIVASGTLSPMKTFQSELNIQFPLTLEANHVINAHQVWIGSVGCGPRGTCLKAIYQQIDTYAFQDDLGELVLQVCQIVPHGVLCFFPSYGALEKVTNRWQLTGLWAKLENYKSIVCEPRKSGKTSFETIMRDYYDIIADEQLNGALFFAVYRGKVSEGLDFADNNARAVISIGIPYPSFKDIQVDLKRKYNDKFCRERPLMTGSDWYETRAFRALNQALGRCIRHRNDWGALMLVDDRFKER